MLQLVLLGLLFAQAPIRISSGPVQCPKCSVKVTHLARLGSGEDPLVPGDLAAVAQDRFGNVYVTSIGLRQPVIKYDKAGRYVRSLGKIGAGPGEFKWPGGVKVWNDTVVVVDISLGRITYFTPAGRYARSADFPMGTEGLVRIRGEKIVYGGVYSDSTNNFPLHVIDKTRDPVRSFGSNGKAVDRTDYYSKYRIIAPSGDSAVWAAYVNRYDIELWSITGKLLLTLSRAVPWYPRWRVIPSGPDYFRPNPRMGCVRDDGKGNLWTVVHVARPDWKPKGPAPKGETAVVPDPDRAIYSETVVEVIRIADGKVIASQRIHDYLDCYLSNGANLLTTRKMIGDDETLDVWSLSLVGK